jgi:hypothetical protein
MVDHALHQGSARYSPTAGLLGGNVVVRHELDPILQEKERQRLLLDRFPNEVCARNCHLLPSPVPTAQCNSTCSQPK